MSGYIGNYLDDSDDDEELKESTSFPTWSEHTHLTYLSILLDDLISDCEIMDAVQRTHRVYREIGNTLVHQQAKMLKEYTYELSRDTSFIHTQ